jgi:hypothetical protein
MRPYLKKPFIKKRASRVVQGVGPEFKSQYQKKIEQGLKLPITVSQNQPFLFLS